MDMSETQNNDQWRPGERPDEPPTHPYDPANPDPKGTNPLPLPSDERQPAPVREPDNPPDPIGDPQRGQPKRL